MTYDSKRIATWWGNQNDNSTPLKWTEWRSYVCMTQLSSFSSVAHSDFAEAPCQRHRDRTRQEISSDISEVFRSAKSFTVIQSSLNHLAEAIAGVYLSSTSALVSALVGRAYRGMIRKACRHVFGVWEWSTLTNCRAMSVADAVSRFKEQAGSGVKLENQCLSSDIIHPKPPKSSWLEALAHCLWGGQLRVECHAMLAMPSYEAFPGFQANASLQAYLNFDPHAESEVCNKADQSCIETGKKMKVLNVSTYASWCSIIKPTWIRLPFTFFNM